MSTNLRMLNSHIEITALTCPKVIIPYPAKSIDVIRRYVDYVIKYTGFESPERVCTFHDSLTMHDFERLEKEGVVMPAMARFLTFESQLPTNFWALISQEKTITKPLIYHV